MVDDCSSTSEPSEDPDRMLVEKLIISVSDSVGKQDPVKKTSALLSSKEKWLMIVVENKNCCWARGSTDY